MATSTVKGDPNKMIIVFLSEVYRDPKWNSRSDLGEAVGGPDEETGDGDSGLGTIDSKGEASGLIATILKKANGGPGVDGQLTPVTLRLRKPTDNWPKQYQYALVAGFRRFEALTRIAEYQGDKKPRVKAIAWDMSEAEAREVNILENAARRNLSGEDLAYGIVKLLEARPGMTQTAIANVVNRNQSYVSKLYTIVTKTKGEYDGQPILTHWRLSPATGKVSIDQMYSVAKLEGADKQAERYAQLVRPSDGSYDQRTPQGKLAAAIKKAKQYGGIIGSLVREDALSLTDEGTFFREYLGEFMTIPKEVADKTDEKGKAIPGITKADVRTVFKAATDAYKHARDNAPAEEDEEETEKEETPKAKGKGKKGNASASAN